MKSFFSSILTNPNMLNGYIQQAVLAAMIGISVNNPTHGIGLLFIIFSLKFAVVKIKNMQYDPKDHQELDPEDY